MRGEDASSLVLGVYSSHFHDADYECNLSVLSSLGQNTRHLHLKPQVWRVMTGARRCLLQCIQADDAMALFPFPLETGLPTNVVVSYSMAPNTKTRAVQGNGHLRLISAALMEIMCTKWKMKVLSVIYEA